MERTSASAGAGSKLIFSRISAKEHVNPPSFPVSLLLLGEIPAHGSTVSSCLRVLLGVSLRPSSGLLEEPTCSRMGSVRLFLFSDARCEPNFREIRFMESYVFFVACIFGLLIFCVIGLVILFVVCTIAGIKELIFGANKKDKQMLEIRIIGQNGTDIDYKINSNSSDIHVDKE